MIPKNTSPIRSLMALGMLGSALLISACGKLPVGMASVDSLPSVGFDVLGGTAGSLSVAFNNTYLETIALNDPIARKDPKNTDKNFIKLIRLAKSTIDGAFYDIEDPGAAQALVAAKKRGVRVRLVTDTDNMVEKSDATKPRAAVEALKAVGVPIVDDQRSAIMHHKFMVVDGQTVWTGSTNLTPTSFFAHNNNALTIKSGKLAAAYTFEFERLFTNRQFGKANRPTPTPPTGQLAIGTATMQAFFSPAGGGREAVVSEVAKAQRSIRFMTFSLTDAETGNAMVARAATGVKVEGVFDRWLAAGKYSLYNTFKSDKLSVVKDGNEALMHHKVIVIDNKTVITGSYNYSENAENNNNEAFLIFRNAPTIAAAYSQEFDRLQYAATHNHPPTGKPKEDDNETDVGNQK